MPFDTPIPAVSLAVVGVDFDNGDGSNRRFALALCNVGDPMELRLEPRNPADENAVAVQGPNGMQIGYITSARAVRISALLREGRELRAIFQRTARFGAWIRVAFDGEVPVLTPGMMQAVGDGHDHGANHQTVAAEPDFYPDEVWPDD